MAGCGRERVGTGIERLEARFGTFPVNQTTLSVAGGTYESVRSRAADGLADVYVRVRNDADEVLHVGEAGDRQVPRCVSDCEGLRGAVRRAVRESTGVECAVTGVDRATIAGVHSEDDADGAPVYRLLVVLDAVREGGRLRSGTWDAGEAALPSYV